MKHTRRNMIEKFWYSSNILLSIRVVNFSSLWMNSADDKLIFFFFYFSFCSKNRLDIFVGVFIDRIQESTVLSTSLGKTFFAWRFISNENILFWLTISYQKPFVLYVSVFYSQIFTQKLKLRQKLVWPMQFLQLSDFFFNFCLRKYFLLFFAEFELLMFYNNIVKISEKN